MIIGTLKLDTNDNYVYEDGSLPTAPAWDKEMLSELVKQNTITPSAINILPLSMKKIATATPGEPTLAVKVSEIDALADLLIVTRVTDRGQSGRKFRFTNFKKLSPNGMIEIYIRNTNDR